MTVMWLPPPRQPELRRGEAHVWFCDFSGVTDFGAGHQVLSKDELQRAARFISEESRQTFVGARIFLRRILGTYLQIPPSAVVFGVEASGKPCLDKSFHLTDLQFNLSHSHRSAACAVTHSDPVGIDIERPDPNLSDLQTAEQVFSTRELCCLEGFEPHERVAAFFRGWTKKEAYAKSKGTGLAANVALMELGFADGNSNVLDVSLLTFKCPNQDVATLAVDGRLNTTAFWEFAAEGLAL